MILVETQPHRARFALLFLTVELLLCIGSALEFADTIICRLRIRCAPGGSRPER
jgi:hypothetical protein